MTNTSAEPTPNLSLNTRLTVLFTCLALIAAFLYPSLLLPSFLRPTTPPPPRELAPLPPSPPRPTASIPSLTTLRPSPYTWHRDPHHPRHRLFTAFLALLHYNSTHSSTLDVKARRHDKLHEFHRRLLQPVDYARKIARARELTGRNYEDVVMPMLAHGMKVYGVTWDELMQFEAAAGGARAREKVGDVDQCVKLILRDWSADGKEEREAVMPQILAVEGVKGKVLVPGAGAGRLVHELLKLERVQSVVANEYSYQVVLTARWLFDVVLRGEKEKKTKSKDSSSGAEKEERSVNAWTAYPSLNWWSHRRRTEDGLFKGVTFPDTTITPDTLDDGDDIYEGDVGRRLTWVEGDFVTAFFNQEATFDSVVTLFFIDTARNLIDYIHRIYELLKPGGTWVNVGPLLYGSAPMVELSLDEVLMVVEEVGFVLEVTDEKWGESTFDDSDDIDGDEMGPGKKWKGKVRRGLAGYAFDAQATMNRNIYEVQYWVARKPREVAK